MREKSTGEVLREWITTFIDEERTVNDVIVTFPSPWADAGVTCAALQVALMPDFGRHQKRERERELEAARFEAEPDLHRITAPRDDQSTSQRPIASIGRIQLLSPVDGALLRFSISRSHPWMTQVLQECMK